ncbi:MAG: hypothetical protein CSA86_01395 [Arcobacter sp.]|nr:MAG: hypothetical protein CSA86_01395 [Arcobacter sp.]
MQNNKNNGLNSNPYINNSVNQQQATNKQAQNTNPYYNVQPTQLSSPVSSTFDTGNFLKGALIGALGAYLLTNEDAQKKIFKTFAKGADMFGAGIEEMKERLEDAKAELEAQREAK